ncbi:MAG: CBS domain-containing protein [Pseudomonadota bacterium]
MAEKVLTVDDILTIKGRKVVIVAPDATITEAARVLAERRIGIVVVSDSAGQLRGVLSERDVVRAVGSHGKMAPTMRVEEFMSRKVVTCKPHTPAQEALKVMNERRFRHIPVAEEGKVVGLISITDLHKHLLEQYALDAEALSRADDEGMTARGEES